MVLDLCKRLPLKTSLLIYNLESDYRRDRHGRRWDRRILPCVCSLSNHTLQLKAKIAVLVDFPATAKFLTPEERAYVIWRKKYDNSTVGEAEHFRPRHVWKSISDWQVSL